MVDKWIVVSLHLGAIYSVEVSEYLKEFTSSSWGLGNKSLINDSQGIFFCFLGLRLLIID